MRGVTVQFLLSNLEKARTNKSALTKYTLFASRRGYAAANLNYTQKRSKSVKKCENGQNQCILGRILAEARIPRIVLERLHIVTIIVCNRAGVHRAI